MIRRGEFAKFSARELQILIRQFDDQPKFLCGGHLNSFERLSLPPLGCTSCKEP